MSPNTPPPVHQSKRSSKGNNNNNNKSARLDYRTNLGNVKRVKKINFERERERERQTKSGLVSLSKKLAQERKPETHFPQRKERRGGRKEGRKTQTKKVLNLNTQVRNNVNAKSKSQEDKMQDGGKLNKYMPLEIATAAIIQRM